MGHQPTDPVTEVKRLQRCMNHLVSVLALPAIWSVSQPSRILETFLDALMGILDLDFLYARVRLDSQEAPILALRTARLYGTSHRREEIGHALNQWFAEGSQQWPKEERRHLAGQDVSVVPIKMGIEGELGLIAAGSQRAGFPEQTESLVLSVAANQLAIGLQQALLLGDQKRVAGELDRRVAERTRELAEANRELQLQVGMLQHLPVSAWTLKPDGTPDFVNRVWLEFSGQTLEFVRSHPEAWMTAIHPEDREMASRAFWEGVRSGQGFAVETRSLRAQDGTYRWHLNQAVALRDAEGNVLRFVGTTTDIDDQKRAQEELRASEGKLRRVIDTIPSLSWCNLPDGPNEFLSQGWHDYTGMSPEEAHGWGWSAAFHPDDLPPLMKRWQELLVSGEPGEIEARIRRHDGVYRWFLIRVAPFHDETGSILRWYGTSTDIDDRKRAEDALQASENNFRQIVDSIPGLVCTMDAAGEIQQLNRPLLEYFGKASEELKNWKMTDAVHPDDLPEVIKAYTHSITTGTPYDIEHRCRRADGVYRWFQVRALPVHDTDNKICGWYVLLTDIEDRKRAEDALRASETNLRETLDNIPALVCTISSDGQVLHPNRPFLEFFGKTLEEMKAWRTSDVVHPDHLPRVIAEFTHSMISGTRMDSEVLYRRADGVYRWTQVQIVPVRDTEGRITVWYGLITDIDDRKRAQEELGNAQAELARMTRVMSIGQLTASIAHEVSQPLSGIITNASTCLRMLKSDPPSIDGARETALRTIRDGKRASEVITRLRTLFSKKEIEVEPLDLNEAVREVIALLSGELERNNVVLKHEFNHHLPAVKGDRVQLQQVILNLIRNASDAMNTVNDRPRQLIIRTETEDNHVTVSVQDSGVGFSAEFSERLFESFFTTKQEGMGIGLSVSRSIVEAHRGRLWAAQNFGPGATFAFSIPQDVSNLPDQAGA
jgi:PAS domain S-box-containing protein